VKPDKSKKNDPENWKKFKQLVQPMLDQMLHQTLEPVVYVEIVMGMVPVPTKRSKYTPSMN
jgi:hypothetical protein